MGDGLRTLEYRTFLLLTVAISLAFAWILWPFYGTAGLHAVLRDGLHLGVQSLSVLGVDAQRACGFRGTLPPAILHALVTTA
jgi:hypothetical protein